MAVLDKHPVIETASRHRLTYRLDLISNPLSLLPDRTRAGGERESMKLKLPVLRPPAALIIHGLCCIFCLALGYHLSRLLVFLLFTTQNHTATSIATGTLTLPLSLATPPPSPNRTDASRVVVGRHGILVRPWPHPNPAEVMRAHRIIDRVQREQRAAHGVKRRRRLIVVTPTYVRTFQALHLTGLKHSLMLLPYRATWIVVEAGGATNDTAGLLASAASRIEILHLPFEERMPFLWADRHRLEARMRLHALRVVREQRLDGIVIFADDSNVHSIELFDEVQSVNWMGAVSIGILAGNSGPSPQQQKREEDNQSMPLPIQGPACNASDQLIGWHTFNSSLFMKKSAALVGGGETVLPTKLEWAGFAINSRLLWEESEGKPDWVRDFGTVGFEGKEIESPLSLLKDASFVEPLGSCGKKVLLWWLRVEARYDSKFPIGWIIDPPLEIIVAAKHTPWNYTPPKPPPEKTTVVQDHVEKRSKTDKSPRPRHGKKKHAMHGDTRASRDP